MRYINEQQHRTSCGPVAIINALKSLGYQCSYRRFLAMLPKNAYDPKGVRGLPPKKLSILLREFGIKFTKRNRVTVGAIEKALGNGYNVILNYQWWHNDETSRHYVFIDKHTEDYFRAWNSKRGRGPYDPKDQLRKWLSRDTRWYSGPEMWLIKKGK